MKPTNLKSNPIRDTIIIILILISLAASIALATMIGIELTNRSQGRDFFSTMYLTYVQPPIQVNYDSTNAIQAQELGPANPAPLPSIDPAPARLDFSGIIRSFPDVVAWIVLDNTVINYPVVQGNDNAFYLTHLPNGKEHIMGSIFMDYRNASNFSDKNTIIYGHNMASGDMFAVLNNYYNQTFYEAHPTMKIMTPHNHYTLTLFAAYTINSAVETIPINFNNNQAFKDFITQAIQRSDFNAHVEANNADRLVTLVTCTNFGPPSYRYIVIGRLVNTP